MHWREYLTEAEREELESIPEARKALTTEYERLYHRAIGRMRRAKAKEPHP